MPPRVQPPVQSGHQHRNRDGHDILYRGQQYRHALLAANVNPCNMTAQGVIHSIQSALMASGSDAVQALQQAYGVVGGMVQRQPAILSFVDTFRMMALRTGWTAHWE
jgi:hypothetical protein